MSSIRVTRFRRLLAPISTDRDALSVLFVAVSNYGSDTDKRINIANDLKDAVLDLIESVDLEETRSFRKGGGK